MSTVLSYNTGEFKILISDTRTTKFRSDGSMYHDDSTLKIHYIDNYGFCVGIGIGELVNRTFNEILKFDCINDFVLHKAYETAYQSFQNERRKNVREYLDHTAVIITDAKGILLFSKCLEQCEDCDCDAVSINKDQIDIQLPPDIKNDEQERLYSLTQTTLKPTLEHILLKMLEIFQQIANASEGVSQTCCIAILGHEFASPFFWKNDVSTTIDILKTNSFSALKNEFEQYRSQLISWESI